MKFHLNEADILWRWKRPMILVAHHLRHIHSHLKSWKSESPTLTNHSSKWSLASFSHWQSPVRQDQPMPKNTSLNHDPSEIWVQPTELNFSFLSFPKLRIFHFDLELLLCTQFKIAHPHRGLHTLVHIYLFILFFIYNFFKNSLTEACTVHIANQ